MVHEKFRQCLTRQYEAVKSNYPSEGRRKWRLRVLYDSWPVLNDTNVEATSVSGIDSGLDHDPLDLCTNDDELGLIIRTDFANDEAWDSFQTDVQNHQKDLLHELKGGAGDPDARSEKPSGADVSMNDVDEDSDSSSDNEPADIVKFINPVDEPTRLMLTDISNLSALRIFNEVDIRPSPPLPAGSKRIFPQNPLIDLGGWQEIYTGKNIWIYDTQSNSDGYVRLVSSAGDFYGTASGDSWRARASHICVLQLDIAQGMKIHFGGLDNWDADQRQRNLSECRKL